MYEGTLTFSSEEQQWKIRQEGVGKEAWYTLEEFSPLSLWWASSWLDGFVYYSNKYKQYRFTNTATTVAFPLSEGMPARCRCGSETLGDGEEHA
jgi:hypothetical protein